MGHVAGIFILCAFVVRRNSNKKIIFALICANVSYVLFLK